MHLPIPLPLLVLGRTGRGDQGRIDDRDLAHRHYSGTEVGFVGLKDLLAEFMLHQQVPEGDNRCLIGDPVAHQLDAGKARILATSIRAFSMAGSLREYHWCSRTMRRMAASG